MSGFLVAQAAVVLDAALFGTGAPSRVNTIIKIIEVDVLDSGWFCEKMGLFHGIPLVLMFGILIMPYRSWLPQLEFPHGACDYYLSVALLAYCSYVCYDGRTRNKLLVISRLYSDVESGNVLEIIDISCV